jgi:2'-5' RNA ligase
VRAFLAIEFPELIKAGYGEALRGFEKRLGGFRWVRPECLHLTLRFLGETTEERARLLADPVVAVASGERPFRLSIGLAGAFGSSRAPRTLWFAVKEGSSTLRRLQPRLEQLVREQGFAPDTKEWRPHITVARARGGRRGRPGATLEAWQQAAVESSFTGLWFEACEITLLSSELTAAGPIYSPIWKAPLGG